MNTRLLHVVAGAAVIVTVFLGLDAAAIRMTPAPTAVGSIDLPMVLQSLDEWKAEQARAESASEGYLDERARMREEVETLRADMDDFVVGSEKYLQAERTMKRAAIDLLAFEQTAQIMEARATQRAIIRMYGNIQKAAGELASRDGYGLIIMDDSAIAIPPDSPNVLDEMSARKVLWADSGLDVTEALITYMNEQWQSDHGG